MGLELTDDQLNIQRSHEFSANAGFQPVWFRVRRIWRKRQYSQVSVCFVSQLFGCCFSCFILSYPSMRQIAIGGRNTRRAGDLLFISVNYAESIKTSSFNESKCGLFCTWWDSIL